MKKTVAVLLALLAVVVLVGEFGTWYIWVGGFDLAVHIDSPAGRPRSVEWATMSNRPADWSEPQFFEPSPHRTADPFDGSPLTAHVRCSGRTSPFGRVTDYGQQRCLLVVAVMPDGRRVYGVADIPDGRRSREVRVTLVESPP